MSAQMVGNFHAAIESLIRALELDPALAKDTMMLGLSAKITGMPPDQAVALLMDPVARTAYMAQIPKYKAPRQRTGPQTDDSVGSFFVNLMIMVVAMTIATVFALYGIASAPESASAVGFNDPASGEPLEVEPDLVGIVFVAVIIAVLSTIGFLINMVGINIAANSMLEGDGMFIELVNKVAPYYAGVFFITIATQGLLAVDPFIASGAIFGSYLLSFVALFWFGHLIGQVYGFGMVYGCVSMALGIVVLVVMACMCVISLTFLGAIG